VKLSYLRNFWFRWLIGTIHFVTNYVASTNEDYPSLITNVHVVTTVSEFGLAMFRAHHHHHFSNMWKSDVIRNSVSSVAVDSITVDFCFRPLIGWR
jgi:hypothetical protein